jgi:hypothetical protein
MKKILVPAIGLMLVWHLLFALSMANRRCLDDMLPAPSCLTPVSVWVNPLTDAATVTAPKAAAFGVADKDMAVAFRMGFDFVASAALEKKLNDSARKYFDLYAMVLPYRAMVEEKENSERPLPFNLTVTQQSNVRADEQGHVLVFVQAHSQDGKKFVLTCHTARSSCSGLQIGADFTFTVLQASDPNYAYDYPEPEQAGAVVVDTTGTQNGVHRDLVFIMTKRQEESAQASDAATVAQPDVPAVTVSKPNRALQLTASNGVCGVDYLNAPVFDGEDTVSLRAGKYEGHVQLGESSVEVKLLSCLDRGVAEHALLATDWVDCGASCNSHEIVQVFELRDGHPALVQQISFDSDAKGTGATFDDNSRTLTITGRSNEESPHCCPKSLDVVTYRWAGQQFVQSSYKRVPVPNS